MDAQPILGSRAYPFFSHLSRPFHVQRTRTAHLTELTVHNGARTTSWHVPEASDSVLEVQTTLQPAQFKDVPINRNSLVPPYHWHWNQDERFVITQGSYIFLLNGASTTHTASSSPVLIPAGAAHTFYADPTSAAPCVIEISASGTEASSGISERFFRNLYSYLDDCERQCIAPSLPQLLLFLHAAEVSLAADVGPAALMRVLSRGFGWLGGRVWGQWFRGYRSTYPEYFDEGEVVRRRRLGVSERRILEGHARKREGRMGLLGMVRLLFWSLAGSEMDQLIG